LVTLYSHGIRWECKTWWRNFFDSVRIKLPHAVTDEALIEELLPQGATLDRFTPRGYALSFADNQDATTFVLKWS